MNELFLKMMSGILCAKKSIQPPKLNEGRKEEANLFIFNSFVN